MTKIETIKARCKKCGTKFAFMMVHSISGFLPEPTEEDYQAMKELTQCPKCGSVYEPTGGEELYPDWTPQKGRLVE